MNVRKVRDSSGSQGGPNSPRSPSTTLSWKSRSRSSNLPVKTYGGEALLKHKAGPLDAAGVDSSLPPLEGSSTRRVCCSQQQTHQAVLERPPKEAAGRLEPKWLLSLSRSLRRYLCVCIYILCIYIYVVFLNYRNTLKRAPCFQLSANYTKVPLLAVICLVCILAWQFELWHQQDPQKASSVVQGLFSNMTVPASCTSMSTTCLPLKDAPV